MVLRPRLSEADGLPDTFRRSMGMPVLALSWWKVVSVSPGKPIECGRIHEGERQSSVPDCGGHAVERHGPL
jgi:hypothetical protein